MRLHEAIAACQVGQSIRRPDAWDSGRYWRTDDGWCDEYQTMWDGKPVTRRSLIYPFDATFNFEEVAATDWEIVP